jgi:hypothetical protein
VFLELRALEVYVCDAWLVFLWLWVADAVLVGTNAELLEFHDVLGECARLVREDVADHAQFFVQVAALDFRRHVLFLVIDHVVVLDEVALCELDHFQTDKQRDTHEVHHDQEPLAKVFEDLLRNALSVVQYDSEVEEIRGVVVVILPCNCVDGGAETNTDLEADAYYDVPVHLFLDL